MLFQLIWMLHAQSRLISEVELIPDGAIKEFIKRMLITKRGYSNMIVLLNDDCNKVESAT